MFKNIFKIMIRNFRKNLSYSLINLAGLATAIACFILIMLWVEDELSYDKFHGNKHEIYRVTVSTEANHNKVTSPTCPRPLGEALQENSPGVIHTSTFAPLPKVLVQTGDIKFYETNVAGADSSFFEIFSFKFIKGTPGLVLKSPYSVVLTENMAKKYFGKKDPLDESLEIDGVKHKVTGIIENVPSQSHIQFDFLTSSSILDKYNNSTNWESINWVCYLLVQKNTNIKNVVNNINKILNSHIPYLVTYIKLHGDLQSLLNIHLNPEYSFEYAAVTDLKIIYIVALVACLVLLIACFNFMNLSTAMAANRIKEIGLRKVAGTNRSQLILQFIGECIFFTAIATGLAICLVEIVLPVFNQFCTKTLQINFLDLKYIAGIICLIIVVGTFAGSYPALFLSSLNPIQILKGNIKSGTKSVVLRKVLIVSQFSISIGLIICAIVLSQQFHFLLNKDLGFNKNNIIYIPIKGKVSENYQAIKNELLEHRNISGVSVKDFLPTEMMNQTTDVDWEGNADKSSVKVEEHKCDYDYFQTLSLPLLQGRNFSKEHATDAEQAFILNEEAAKQMGIKSPVGKSFSLHHKQGIIIGVVKNAYFHSLQNKISPQVYSLLSDLSKCDEGIVLIKYRANEYQNLSDIIKTVENIMLKYNPDYPFEFNFLDKKIEQNYVELKQFDTIIKYLTLLAVITAFLGLLGLTLFTIKKRTMEIGIRKVLGAPITSIFFMVTKDFTNLIILANFIAWPIAYYFMNKWLQHFAYHINLTVWPFLLAGLTVLFIALLTVSWQTIRAATANPVKSLKYE